MLNNIISFKRFQTREAILVGLIVNLWLKSPGVVVFKSLLPLFIQENKS